MGILRSEDMGITEILNALSEALWTLWDPWPFMWISATHIPKTVRDLLSSGAYSSLISPDDFSEALFGNFWATVGPNVRLNAGARVIPLLEGRVSGGTIHDEPVGPPVSGVVLEVGAGSGLWADVFKQIGAADHPPAADSNLKRRKPAAGRITKIYGVEPNPQSYKALGRRVQEIGLGEIYEVVPVGIESVGDPTAWDGEIAEGSVDCIVSILCLCSIPDQEENVRRLHKLLKPGGRWYVYEHVRTTGFLMKVYQSKLPRFSLPGMQCSR